MARNRVRLLSVQSAEKLHDIYLVGLQTTAWKTWVETSACLVPEARLVQFTIFGEAEETSNGIEQHEDVASTEGGATASDAEPIGDETPQPQPMNARGGTEMRLIPREARMRIENQRPCLSVENLETEARLLLDSIQQAQSSTAEGKNLVLVGYGLGSIVIKQALLLANSEPEYDYIGLRTSKVVAVHTPRFSSDIGAWEDLLWDIIQETDFEINGRRAQALTDLTIFVDKVNTDFYRHAPQYSLYHLPQYRTGIDERKARSILAPSALVNQGFKSQVMQERFLLFLKRLSSSVTSTSKMSRMHVFEPLADIDLYRKHAMQWDDASLTRYTSVQVIGAHSLQRASVLRSMVQKLRQKFCGEREFTLIVLEISPASTTRNLIVAALLHQILEQRPCLFSRFQQLHDEHSKLATWTEETIASLLPEILSFLRAWKVAITIENFDTRSDETISFVRRLEECLSCLELDYTFLISSQSKISDQFHQHARIFDLSTATNEPSVQLKIREVIRSHPTLRPIQEDIMKSLESIDLPPTIVHQYVSWLIHTLPLCTPDNVKSSISRLHKDGTGIYRSCLELLQRETPEVLAWCTCITSWVLHAVRPLRLQELAVTAAIPQSKSETGDSSMRSRISLSMNQDIERYLGFLLRIDNDTTFLVDPSIRSFLTDELPHCSNLGHFRLLSQCQLTTLCLDYLTNVITSKGELCLSQFNHRLAKTCKPDPELDFLNYAVKCWPAHYDKAESGEEALERRVLEFLAHDNLRVTWYRLFHSDIPPSPEEAEYPQITALEIISELGLSSLVRKILRKNDGTFELSKPALDTALASAVRANRYETADVLLDAGARKTTAILDAARNGNVALFRRLWELENTAESNLFELSPLHVAAQAGRLKTVKEAITIGIGVSSTDENERTPLHAAVIGGNVEIIRLLLERQDCDVNAEDEYGCTPLELAGQLGQINALRELCVAQGATILRDNHPRRTVLHSVVQADSLFASGIESQAVNLILSNSRKGTLGPLLPDESGITPLHHACSHGCFDIFKQLVDFIGEETLFEQHGHVASDLLRVAAGKGYVDIVDMLLSHNANISTDEKANVIKLAVLSGHLQIVEMLYSEDGLQDDDELLHCASKGGHFPIIHYLLSHSSRLLDEGDAVRTAASHGHLLVLQKLLERSFTTVADTDTNGQTPLHQAALAGHTEVALLLLKRGADINSLNHSNESPIHLAATKGHVDMVRLLLDHGASMSESTIYGLTVFHLAVRQPNIVSLLVKRSDKIDALDYNDKTALHLAAEKGYLESTRYLTEGGANVDLADHRGLTPFHYAIKSNSLPILKILWNKKRPDMSFKYYERRPLALYAIEVDNMCAFEFFYMEDKTALCMQDLEGRTPLFMAAQKGLASFVEKYANKELLQVTTNFDLQSPLHIATIYGHEDVVVQLLKAGADPNAQNADNETPLHLAVFETKMGIAKALIQADADVRVHGPNEKTALHMGVDNEEMAEYLLEKGAEINAKDHRGWTPLFQAVYWEREDCVAFLLTHDPDLTIQDIEGKTALHVAAEEGLPEILQMLVNLCCKNSLDILDKQDNSGSTALQYVAYQFSAAMILIRGGADPMVSNEGSSPLLMAAESWSADHNWAFLEFLEACISRMATDDAVIESPRRKELLRALFFWDAEDSATDTDQFDSSRLDVDGWGLSHYLYHNPDWSELVEPGGLGKPASGTFPPSAFVCPDDWPPENYAGSFLKLSSGGTMIEYRYNGGDDYGVLSVRADHPFPPRGTGRAYFEVDIIDNGSDYSSDTSACPIVGIGLCGKPAIMPSSFVGWAEISIGFHGDNGCIYEESGGTDREWEGKGQDFGPGDTVGCGIDWSERALYFTLNGKFLGRYQSKLLSRKLYPTVSIGGESCKVNMNFGRRPFRYNPDGQKNM